MTIPPLFVVSGLRPALLGPPLLVTALSVTLLLAPSAAAHGGGYVLPGLPGMPGKPTAAPTPGNLSGSSRYRVSAPPRDSWDFWWEYNGERLLGLGDPVQRSVTGTPGALAARRISGPPRRARRPPAYVVTARVVPALLAILEASDDTDMLDSAVLALARSAEAVSTDGIIDEARRLIDHPDPGVASAAALALGVLRSPRSVPALTEIVTGDVPRPALVRAFAALGLGLLGAQAGGDEAVQTLLSLADGGQGTVDETRVAAVVALGLVGDARRMEVTSALKRIVSDVGTSSALKPHAATSLGRLGDPIATTVLLAVLRDPASSAPLRQSAAAALGTVASLSDAPVREALVREALQGNDDPARHFAVMALGRLGAAAPASSRAVAGLAGPGDHYAAGHAQLTEFLVAAVERPSRKRLRSWAALAAGLYGGAHRARRGPLVEALSTAYGRERDPSVRGALVLGLGLLDARTMAARLERDMRRSVFDDFKGHAAQALALLRHEPAVPFLLDIVGSRRITPTLRMRVASALALLDPQGGAERLAAVLKDVPDRRMKSAAARALGVLGGEGVVDVLLGTIADETLSAHTRAFAIVGLGLACERSVPRWNAALREDLNWHLPSPTIAYAIDIL